tara:strand:- start:328 stop:843 length:516 start_codon:yes stop_codon:yes gene_type:complete
MFGLSTITGLFAGKTIKGFLLNPKVIAIILVLVVLSLGVWKWNSITTENFEIKQQNTELVQKNKDLSDDIATRDLTIKKMAENIQKIQNINESLAKEKKESEKERKKLIAYLDSLEIEETYNESPEKANEQINEIFQNNIRCIGKISVGVDCNIIPLELSSNIGLETNEKQ